MGKVHRKEDGKELSEMKIASKVQKPNKTLGHGIV